MSVIDGESVRAYNKTLNGLDTLGDTTIGDLTVTGDLKVEGASTMEGGLDMTDTKITELADPTDAEDAANKQYVDAAHTGKYIRLSGDAMDGAVSGSNTGITNINGLNLSYTTGGSTSRTNILGLNAVGATGETVTFNGSAVVTEDFTVNGTTTFIDTTHLRVKDKDIQLAYIDGGSETDVTANGGGIILEGTTQKKLIWNNDAVTPANSYWELSGGKFNLDENEVYNVSKLNMLNGTSPTSGDIVSVGDLKQNGDDGAVYFGQTKAGGVGYKFPTASSSAGFLLGISPTDTTELTFQDPLSVLSSVWEETAGSATAYDTVSVRGTQADKAVSIGYTGALNKSNFVRLFAYDATQPVISRVQSGANLTLDTICNGTGGYSQILANNATAAANKLYLTGKDGVVMQHTTTAGATTDITATTASSLNTAASINMGLGLGTAVPESCLVANGSVDITSVTQTGVHLGQVSNFGIVEMVGTGGGSIETQDQTDTAATTFNNRILYEAVDAAGGDRFSITNRARGTTSVNEWFSGNGDVQNNNFQGYEWYTPLAGQYCIKRESGAWSAPYPNLLLAFGTGIKYVANVGVSGSHKFYTDGVGTTKVAEISGSGKIESNYNPMIYASGVTTTAGTGFLRSRNCTSITLTAYGQYTIALSITMPSTNYSVTINPEGSPCNGYVYDKTTTSFKVVTYFSSSASVVTISFGFVVVDFE